MPETVQQDSAARPSSQTRLLTPEYRGLFITLLLLVCLFNFADRAIFAVLGQVIKKELQLTDMQFGLLAGPSFAFLYAIAGLPIARFSERTSRVRIIAVATAFWSIMTALCGAATGFFSLMLARFGVGIGEAGFLAPMNSMVGDLFPKMRRGSTTSLIMLGSPLGALLGALVGGWVAVEVGWREAFVAMGLPGVVAALFVVIFLREPDRGLVDNLPRSLAPPPDFAAFLKVLFRKRALLLIIIGGGLAGFASTSISSFMPIFLQRMHHLDVRQVSAFYGPISAVSVGLGLMGGSFGGEFLARRGDARWLTWAGVAGLGFAPIVYWAAFTTPSLATATVLLTLGGALVMLFYGPTVGMIQNMLEPRMRATGIVMFTLLSTILGSGLAPPIVGWLSDKMAARAFVGENFAAACPHGLPPLKAATDLVAACAAASATGVQQALMTTVCAGFIGALAYLLASFTVRQSFYDSGQSPTS